MHSGPSRQSRSAQPPTALRRGEYGSGGSPLISFCAAPGRYRRRAEPPPAPPGQGRPRPKRKNCCFPSVQRFRLLQIPWFFLLSCWPGDMHPALVWLPSAGAAQCLGSRSSLCPVAPNQLGPVAQRGSGPVPGQSFLSLPGCTEPAWSCCPARERPSAWAVVPVFAGSYTTGFSSIAQRGSVV